MLAKIKGKRAQGSVPIVIIVFAIFLIIYMYSLPKSEKCSLMPDLKECRVSSETGVLFKPEILFSDIPGFLEKQEKSSVYAIKPLELFNQQEIEVATILEKTRVSKSWFYNVNKKAVFPAHSKGKELKIFIYVSKAQGSLYVNINPQLTYVFNGAGTHELSIPVNLLNDTNIIRLSASIPILPHETNFYEIEKIIIKETYALTDLYVKRNFSVDQELSQLESASLSFNADCLTKELLSVTLNNVQLSKKISCDETSLDITKVIKKNNSLVFSSNGNYFVHSMKVSLYFRGENYTTYYLVLNKDEYSDIKKGKTLAMLHFNFDSNEKKSFEIRVNDDTINAETDLIDYKTRINSYLAEGINKIRIIPRTPVMLRKIELSLE